VSIVFVGHLLKKWGWKARRCVCSLRATSSSCASCGVEDKERPVGASQSSLLEARGKRLRRPTVLVASPVLVILAKIPTVLVCYMSSTLDSELQAATVPEMRSILEDFCNLMHVCWEVRQSGSSFVRLKALLWSYTKKEGSSLLVEWYKYSCCLLRRQHG
jgi:hypothetical protein